MKISAIQILAIAVILIGVLSMAIVYSFRTNNSDNSVREDSKAMGNSKLRYILAEHLAEDKESVWRVHATQCNGGATVWNARASFSYVAPTNDAKELDSASWEVISKLLSRHLRNLSRNTMGSYAPSHYIHVDAEFCQITIPVYSSGEPGSYDLVSDLIEATGGAEGMSWAPN